MMDSNVSSVTANGILSKAISSLEDAEQQVVTLTNLPPAAQDLVNSSNSIIKETLVKLGLVQDQINALIEGTKPRLDEIEALLSQGGPLVEMKEKINIVALEASSVNTSVTGVKTDLVATAEKVYAFPQKLQGIKADLEAQQIKLKTQIGVARSNEEAARKKYDYFLLLGPLGGPIGVAASLIARYEATQAEVATIEGKIHALNSQVLQFQKFQEACIHLISDFQTLSGRISGVTNSLDLLTGDITKIVQDINEDEKDGKSRTLLEVYLKASEAELESLRADAS